MIVVDTNIIVNLFKKGEHTDKAKSLLFYDSEWISPFLWRSEFRNILALYIQKKYFEVKVAQLIMNETENLMSHNEYEVKSQEIFELANNSNCFAYDCEFVALANKLNLKLYTSDKKILKEFPQIAYSLANFSSEKNIIS